MDFLLDQVTKQAMNYAVRSGITIASGFAIQSCAKLLQNTGNGRSRQQLAELQGRLEHKMSIIGPSVDMIELIAARGNTCLESAVSLTKSIRWELQTLGLRLSEAAASNCNTKPQTGTKAKADEEVELLAIIADMQRLLARIEDAVPLINLAITTSGVNLSSTTPDSVSPSRLLQASTFLTTADTRFSMQASGSVQVGPTFTLSMYMLFLGHAQRAQDDDGFRTTVWKEVIHKAQVKLVRTPLDLVDKCPFTSGLQVRSDIASDQYFRNGSASERRSEEFAYQLAIIEDLDDGRVHTFDDGEPEPSAVDDVKEAGLREYIPIHQLAKIFYADTGKVLNIGSDGEANNPVLLLKRDVHAPPPRRMLEHGHRHGRSEGEYQSPEQEGRNSRASESEWSLPSGLDPEWIALEVFTNDYDPDSDSDSDSSDGGDDSPVADSISSAKPKPTTKSFLSTLAGLRLTSPSPLSSSNEAASPESASDNLAISISSRPVAAYKFKTSLSLLEMLIRLTSLQQYQQVSHLSITDELLKFFLAESSTTGAGSGDPEARKRVRMEARSRVGFDPYDESPIKRRGEDYQAYQDVAHGHGHGEVDELLDGNSPRRYSFRWQQNSSGPSTPQRQNHSQPESPPMTGDRRRSSRSVPPGSTKPLEQTLKSADMQVKSSPLRSVAEAGEL